MSKTKSAKLISEDLNNPERIEKKQIEYICEACSKLIQQCSKKEMKVADLKWQPHYSTVFKQLKSQLESILASDGSKSLDKLNTIPYLLALKNEIFVLLNSFSKFLLANSALIGTKDSTQRKNFFIKVVHFQFLCHEIQAYFPSGIYSPSKFKISKNPARAWWERMFGEITFVELDTFVNKFKEDYQFVNQAEIFSFKNSINFTSTNFMTTFEFDLFTRLYSPWEKVHQAWRIIYNHPGYLHFSTYGDTKDILSHYLDKPGTYVFRVSCKDLGFWTIGYVKGSKDMGQIKVDKTNLIEALVEGQKKNMYLYPNGELCNPDLSNLNEFRKEIIVKNEELQLYDCFEDYKECKICREGEKDLQLESCGHQICHACYKLLRKYDKKLCPFCNQKILSTTKVVNIQNSDIYVDPNPAHPVVKATNDSLYADMTSDNKDGDDETSQRRLHTIIRTGVSSVYSNMSDDASSNDHFSSLPLPDAPPRPPRDKSVFLTKDSTKTDINYPPIQKMKPFEIQSNHSSMGSSSSKVNIGPPSPVYAEMTSNVNITNMPRNHVEDLYSDVTDVDVIVDNVINSINSTVNNRGYAITTPSTSIPQLSSSSFHNTTIINDPEYQDDIYYTPNDVIQSSIVTINHQNGYNVQSQAEPDDIYCDPISMNHDDGIYNVPLPTVYHQVQSSSTNQPRPSNVIRDTEPLHSFKAEVYSNLEDNNIRAQIQDRKDEEVYSILEDNHASRNIQDRFDDEVYSNVEDIPTSSVKQDCVVEEVYSNVEDHQTNTVVSDLFFSGWTERDIERAMRVAHNDRQLAMDILQEFVSPQ